MFLVKGMHKLMVAWYSLPAFCQRTFYDKIFQAEFGNYFFDAGSFLMEIFHRAVAELRRPVISRTIRAFRKPDATRFFFEIFFMRSNGKLNLSPDISII